MRINYIIVEDEPLAMERIREYAAKLPLLHLLGTFDNGIDALLFLKANTVDLVFLDINMGALSGIQLLEAGAARREVIITTAYHEYAIKGFELNVTDYLLKPFTFDRFLQAVERAQHNLEKQETTFSRKFIFVKTEYRLEKIDLDDLLYVEGMRDYRKMHLKDRKIMTLQTFGDLEQELPASVLCRVHKSYMVAPARIDAVEREGIRIGNNLIPISDTYRRRFLELIRSV